MRMSCNGCRILRKGCSDDCTIKPCLEWIKSSDSQANATLFLAKFYGRAGLINLIEAGPQHLRPAIFRSLLYEACGRIVDPISGSVGLLWSGKWVQCQAAVEAVLKGKPIKQNPSSSSSSSSTVTTTTTSSSGAPAFNPIIPPLKIYDIRHVGKETTSEINKTGRFKRSWNRRPKAPVACDHQSKSRLIEALSHDSWLSQLGNNAESSIETVEGSMMNVCQRRLGWKSVGLKENSEVGLELTLGLASSDELVKEQQV